MDYGKQVPLTDALCAAILRQGDTPTPAEWERIKALAERVREEMRTPGVIGYASAGHNHYEWTSGMDALDMAFLRATGRAL